MNFPGPLIVNFVRLRLSKYEFPFWILLAVLLLIGNLVVGFNGLYGQDSFQYLLYSRSIHHFISGGIVPGIFHWPVLYPLTGALLSYFLQDIIANQLISIVSYGLTFFFLQKTLWVLYPERKRLSSLFLLLFFGCSPFVIRHSSAIMSDPLTFFFISAFFYFFLMYLKEKKNIDLIAVVFMSSAAVNTRYAAVVIVIIPLIILVIRFFRKFQLIPFLISVIAAFVIFLPGVYLHYLGDHNLFSHLLIPQWSFLNYFHRSFFTSDGYLTYSLPNICFTFLNLVHPGFIFAGIVFLPMIRKSTLKGMFFKVTGIATLLYFIFLAGLPWENARFFLISFPLLILLYADPFFRVCDMITHRLNSRIIPLLIIVVVIVQLSLTFRAFIPFYKNSKIEYGIAEHMKMYPSPAIYTFNVDLALKTYGIKNKIVNLWETRIKKFDQGSLVLFNYPDCYKQWKGLNPMLNWESLKSGHEIRLIERLPGNWDLYEIDK